MTLSETEDGLDTDKSQPVDQDSGGGESRGRKSAKKVIEIKRKK